MPFFIKVRPDQQSKRTVAKGADGTTLFVGRFAEVVIERVPPTRALFASHEAAKAAADACIREGQAYTLHRCAADAGDDVATQTWTPVL